MKIIESEVEVVEQEPGILGMFKFIEKIGKVSHKSEEGITEDSWKRFIQAMKNCGHYAVFDMGTVYMKIPIWNVRLLWKLLSKHPWSKLRIHGGNVYVTTTFRIIVQLDLEDAMKKYWEEPGEYHKRRVTSKWTCSRLVSHQIVRHASLRPLQESQRYCKYEDGVTYIIPAWVYGVRDLYPEFSSLSGEELWNALRGKSDLVKNRDKFWKKCESEYLEELKLGLKAEDARGVLANDTKTELYLCGYLEDWYKHPKTKERTGFFYLRSDKSAQTDVRILSQKLEEEFKKYGYDKIYRK